MKTVIHIKKEILRDYFNYLFPDKEGGSVIISRNNGLGYLMCAIWSISDPRKEKACYDSPPILVKLPICPSTTNASKHFIYYTREANSRINDYLQAMFDIDFARFVVAGLDIGMSRKEIANKFILDRKLVSFDGDNEMLLKRHYRQDLKRFENLRNYLIERSKYFDKKHQKSCSRISPNKEE